jgi:DNA excision repair protein ERCC-3
MNAQKPLIIQSDRTLMLEVGHPGYVECRDFLALFAELVKSPEFIHTYRVTPLSLWNATALDVQFKQIVEGLETFSRYGIPSNVIADMREWMRSMGNWCCRKLHMISWSLKYKTPEFLNGSLAINHWITSG